VLLRHSHRLLLIALASLWLLATAAHADEPPKVTLGIDVLLSDRIELVQGKRLGLLTNPSAVDGQLVTTLERLRRDPRVKLVQLYAPEHGLAGATANGTSNRPGIEPSTGLPIEGLFGGQGAPSQESLGKLDAIIFDIQDIGSRTYTFVSTLGKLMYAAKTAGVTVIVLDRPNPHGGLTVEGPMRQPKYKSLIGWGPFPVTHGMTIGEVADFYNKELKIGCKLEVVKMKGWRRSMLWDDTGLTWVPPSPGIPKPLNAVLYVATGMVCGSGPNCNEGGGNAMPFELIGAPWIDPALFANALNEQAKDADGLRNLHFRAMTWLPWHGQYDGKTVHGAQLHLKSYKDFRPLRAALLILTTLQKHFGNQLKIADPHRFGRVWGNDEVLQMLRAGRDWQSIEASWQDELTAFGSVRARHLLYEP